MRLTFAAVMLLLVHLASTAKSEPAPKPKMRDAVTHEQLARAMRKADVIDPMKALTAVEGKDPSTANQPANLLEQSDIICFGGIATLVPKRAILATPSAHKERLTFTPGSQIVSWADFYSKNRGWITTIEVSRTQAEGNLALAEETATRVTKSKNLVVATYMGGPISVLPLKLPPPESTKKTAISATPIDTTTPPDSETPTPPAQP